MKKATVRFYAELNDFLPPERRGRDIEYGFAVSGSVKDVIETLGVPHTEVDLILADGEPAGFGYQVKDGDHLAVYPLFRNIDVSSAALVRPPELEEAGFVLDGHLGRLAAYLRMLGFDALYRNDYKDEELAAISAAESRILLTMDRGLLKRSIVQYGYFVREREPKRQLAEVARRFALASRAAPFTRCLRCNALLVPAAKEAVAARLPENTRKRYDEFAACPACNRIYWKGSHYQRMVRLIESLQGR